ncbi:MAG: hypothetical protein WBC22_20415 [Sedimentisphaerales bacterium]
MKKKKGPKFRWGLCVIACWSPCSTGDVVIPNRMNEWMFTD